MANKWVSYGFDRYEWEPDEIRLAWMITALGDWADDDGVSFPGVKTLAKRCKVDPRHAITLTKKLENRGDIYVLRPERQGRGNHNYYLIIGDRSEAEIAEIIDRHPAFSGINGTETAQSIFDKRLEAGRNVKEDRLTPETFTPEVEIEMLVSWGRPNVPKGFDANILASVMQAIERSTFKLSEDQKVLACYLVHATQWELPKTSGDRKAWKRAFTEHIEMFGSLERIGRLYAAAFLQMKQYQKRAMDQGRGFPINPIPNVLTKTMRAINQEWITRERDANNDLFGDVSEDEIKRLMSDPSAIERYATR